MKNKIGILENDIYIFPIVISYIQLGPNLSGNAYQLEISYIQTTNQLFDHFLENLIKYFNLFSNPIFWFFIHVAELKLIFL